MRRAACSRGRVNYLPDPARLVASESTVLYVKHMKRTNLVLREDLLRQAVSLSGEKTYSRAVERALEDFVRRAKARKILELRGSGLWEGDLGTMRRDRSTRTGRRS